MQVYVYAHMHIHMRTCIYICTYMNMHVVMHVSVNIREYIFIRMYTLTRTHRHKQTHTCIHNTYTFVNVHVISNYFYIIPYIHQHHTAKGIRTNFFDCLLNKIVVCTVSKKILGVVFLCHSACMALCAHACVRAYAHGSY